MMLMLIGQMYSTPAIPKGIRRVKAASGPYAAELSASSPKTGMPFAGPILSAFSSSVARGRPSTRSANFMAFILVHDFCRPTTVHENFFGVVRLGCIQILLRHG